MANTVFNITTSAANETASFYLAGVGGAATISVDWGDGSTATEESLTTSSKQISHQYATAGDYEATLTISSGKVKIWRSNSVVSLSSNITGVTTGDGLSAIGKYSFYNLANIDTVTLGDEVTSIEDQAFYKCKIKHLVVGNGCTSIGYSSFGGCTALEDAVLGSSVATIDDDAFGGCSALVYMDIYAETPPTITGTTFSGNTELDKFRVPSDSVSAYEESDWATVATIEAIPAPEPPEPTPYVDPDEYDPESVEDTAGDADPEQALSGAAFKDILDAYGPNLKFIKTENNTIAVNQRVEGMPYITSDDLIIRRFHGYDFVECTSYDAFFRREYISLIRINDIRTFVIAKNARQTLDGFRC